MPIRSRRSTRRTFRRSVRKRRFARRRTFKRRASTRRQILNVSSTKKHDDMQSLDGAGNPGSRSVGASNIFAFCATGRALDGVASTLTPLFDISGRNSNTIYARGIKERIQVTVQGGTPWRWRRIMFSTKDFHLKMTNPALWTSQVIDYNSTRGYSRPNIDIAGNTTSFVSTLFAGVQNADFDNLWTAKIDTTRVKVHMDRTITINPGNATGHSRTFKFWTPLNKTIMYDDTEAGEDMSSSVYSTSSKPGMGDVYIVDMIQRCFGGVTPGETLLFDPETTFYWHER